MKSLNEYLQLMDCVNLFYKISYDFVHKFNSPRKYLHTNSHTLISVISFLKKRGVSDGFNVFLSVHNNEYSWQACYTIIFILSWLSNGNCIALALTHGNDSGKSELTGMSTGYKMNKGAA